MNNTKINRRNVSDSGSIVRKTLKAHKEATVASVEEVNRVRNSNAFLNMKREVAIRANGRSELSGAKFNDDKEVHHIEDIQHHIDKACNANNVVAMTHMEHKLYHEVYNRTKSGVTVDKADTAAMWNKFVKAFKAGKLDKSMKVVEAKDARVKQIAKFVKGNDLDAQRKALKDIAGVEVVKMMSRRDNKIGIIVDADNRDKVRKAFLDNHIQIFNAVGGNFQIQINA